MCCGRLHRTINAAEQCCAKRAKRKLLLVQVDSTGGETVTDWKAQTFADFCADGETLNERSRTDARARHVGR